MHRCRGAELRQSKIRLKTDSMIACAPKSICSWEFFLSGPEHSAETHVNLLGEQGALTIDGVRYSISKDGIFSGKWNLESDAGVIYSAQKSSVFSRTFEISGAESQVVLSARSAFMRAMQLSGSGYDCTISPDHAFTRRSTISGSWSDFRMAAFAFWLTILLWRRQANKS
jgi:hypothetical protein